MKTAVVPDSWIRGEGCRLDPKPYISGAVQIRNWVLSLPHCRLSEVTSGFKGGIFTHLFSPKRTYVTDRRYGIPFLGASSMRLADLGGLPLLSLKDANSRSYSPLKIHAGMTLVSCSGSVGRMVYARSDMNGMASAGDLLKVQPNKRLIPPGYLFAYMSCRVGSTLVSAGTYGTIVQHLETEHVADLPVPRLGQRVEQRAHDLVERAASARIDSATMFKQAEEKVRELLKPEKVDTTSRWTTTVASLLQSRLDAYYFSAPCMSARRAFDGALVDEHRNLGEVADVFIPGIFKRRYSDDPRFGYPYITGGDVFQISPTSDQYLLKSIVDQYQLKVSNGTILIQEAGQLGGLIGRSVLVGSYLDGYAVSNNMVRVTSNDDSDIGYLFAVLSTPEGVRLVARESAGSSIPHLDVNRVRAIRIPWPTADFRREVGDMVMRAQALRDRACDDENAARALVERAIEETG